MSKTLNHILCIDDDEDILEVTKIALETIGGFEVTICNNGTDGIQAAIDLKPDLILIDVMMPDMDGQTVLKKLRQNSEWNDVPLIFMTARVQPEEIQYYLMQGAAGVVAKPFDPMKLSEDIKEIWRAFK